ncbi:unnamed protein product [Hydatigera taeniaeformis]|uniref:WSC domain-containing protein n=1 Tax=Hydatigena taeniaeformis TaxID=6205 RepID=A0A0R3WNK9_HYDTA|nr:unnamed protein product [Hydatigera taeniaeformis]
MSPTSGDDAHLISNHPLRGVVALDGRYVDVQKQEWAAAAAVGHAFYSLLQPRDLFACPPPPSIKQSSTHSSSSIPIGDYDCWQTVTFFQIVLDVKETLFSQCEWVSGTGMEMWPLHATCTSTCNTRFGGIGSGIATAQCNAPSQSANKTELKKEPLMLVVVAVKVIGANFPPTNTDTLKAVKSNTTSRLKQECKKSSTGFENEHSLRMVTAMLELEEAKAIGCRDRALAPQRKGCEKLYEALMKVHSAKSCAIRELVVVENVANVLAERVSSVPNTLIPLLAASHSPHSSPPPPPPPTTTTTATTKATTAATTTNTTAPDKVIESMQYFLQGIGLVSHIKMQTTPLNLNRRMSMEDYDKPMGRIQLAGGFRPNLTAPNDVADESNN